MKKLYIAPELEILRFAPAQSIANSKEDEKFSVVEDNKYWEDTVTPGGDGDL